MMDLHSLLLLSRYFSLGGRGKLSILLIPRPPRELVFLIYRFPPPPSSPQHAESTIIRKEGDSISIYPGERVDIRLRNEERCELRPSKTGKEFEK